MTSHHASGELDALHTQLSTFLEPYLSKSCLHSKPFIILAWSQSLDAKISPSSTERYPLSCWETWYMTHMIRRRCDAIVIGAQTAVTDNPTLMGEKLSR